MVPGGPVYGAVRDGAVAVTGDRIVWVGPLEEAPRELTADPRATLDLEGGWLTPGLIDCHTHLVFGGDRADEFARRQGGATYEEIARAGGGILSTVRATRAASDAALYDSAAGRLQDLSSEGVTTVEIKSGYGLDTEQELRMLSIARLLADRHPVTVSTTLLAAHALPEAYAGRREAYVDLVCDETIPRAAAAGLADAVDAFCEGIAFTPAECARVLTAGAAAGLPGRLHADQLSDLGGAALAARCGARSADHLEYASTQGIAAMARAGTTAVLLPGAFHFLGETTRPPIDSMRRHGVALAVATDLNPGSSPVRSLVSAMHLACVRFGLTPEEALAGATRNAAPVLGLDDRGMVRAGLRADLAAWDVGDPAELSYWLGGRPCRAVVQGGRLTTH